VAWSVYRYTKTHYVHIYRYECLWRATRSDKKQNEDIQNKGLASKIKKMSNTDLTKNPVEPLIHENTNKSQTCSWIYVVYGYFRTLSKDFVNANNKSNRPVWWCHVPRENQVTDKHYYTTIPHSKPKDRLRDLVQLCSIKKNGQNRYKYLVLGRDKSYFVNKTLWFY
jgi:hypothetical protein